MLKSTFWAIRASQGSGVEPQGSVGRMQGLGLHLAHFHLGGGGLPWGVLCGGQAGQAAQGSSTQPIVTGKYCPLPFPGLVFGVVPTRR